MRDSAVIALLIGFPVVLFLLGYTFSRLSNLAASLECPSCRQRFPLDDVTLHGVHCMHCDWRLVASESDREANS